MRRGAGHVGGVPRADDADADAPWLKFISQTPFVCPGQTRAATLIVDWQYREVGGKLKSGAQKRYTRCRVLLCRSVIS